MSAVPSSHKWAAAVLMTLLGLQAVGSMVRKSVTVDEITYITAGYHYLQTGDFLYNVTNPALMKMTAALPLLAFDLDLPQVERAPEFGSDVGDWRVARLFMYDNRLDADVILFLTRLPIVCLAICLAWLVWRWTREIYGSLAGLSALFFFCFSPNILAHSRLATQDLGLTVATFAATYCFWRYLCRPTLTSVMLTGICCGLALAAKTPAVLLAPIFAAYGLACIVRGNGLGINERFPGVKGLTERHPRWGQTLSYVWLGAALAAVAILTVNVVYGFSGSLTESVKGIPIPLPASFVQGLKYQFALGGSSSGVYFAGQIHPDGLWYKLPASLLIKTPIPLLLLLGASLISMAIPPRKLEVEWLWGAFIGCFLLVFSLSSVDGGIRYVLPIYPFLFVLVGRVFRPPSGRWKALALSAGAFWFLISSLNCFPHYLAYCNELIGGSRNGYKYFAGPNLDWGQDLRGLKDYMDEEGIETIQLAYYGSADAAHYGIDYDYLPSVGLAPKEPGQLWWYEMGRQSRKPLQPQKGKIAISATLLAAPRWMRPLFYDDYAWLRDRKPIEQIGHSILIYEIDEDAAD